MATIKIQNLKYNYPEKEKNALNNINIEIPQGEFVLIVGGSGSGKSSLVRAIAGLIPNFYGGNYFGDVYIDDKELDNIERRELVQKVGMVFQNPESQLVMTDPEQEIAFGLENIQTSKILMKRRIMEVSSLLSLSKFKNSFIAELSGGQKQKVALASVLAMQPDIILLDEPTSQLDPIAGEEILTLVRRLNEENGTTIVLIEQKLERCFHFADRILVMDKGEIIKDSQDISDIARWSVHNKKPFIPPLSRLFANTGYSKIPVTVKEGRRLIGEKTWENSNENKEIIKKYNNKQKREISKKYNIKRKKEIKEKENYLIDIKNLWFSYENSGEILKNVNLKIKESSFTVVMGENGGGKTTLLKNINGLLKPNKGKVNILGKDTKKMYIEEISKYVAYLSQNPNDYLFLPTVREEVEFTLKKLGMEKEGRVDTILEKLEIKAFENLNPRDLSTGERQRVALASVLAVKPKVLLLDEPTRGLDYELKESLGRILEDLQKEGTAIFIVSHDVEFAAEYAEDIVLLYDGSIIEQGNKKDILTKSIFYSPQISRLFQGFKENIVTVKQGEKSLEDKKEEILNEKL